MDNVNNSKNTKWYQNSYRRNLVDMHIDAWNEEFLSKFDPYVYFQCLKEANIKSPMIYTHSHVGYCNWDSASGEMHPNFHKEDKIKTLFELCEKEGMDVIAYYSLIYHNWAYEKYPAWRMIDVYGNPSRAKIVLNEEDGNSQMMIGQGRYGLVCPNNQEYREFIKLQMAELYQNYRFKGIFLDMTFWPMICYCDSCRKRFRDETGLELPETIDWKDPVWLRFHQAREEWISEFAQFATAECKKQNPDITVEHQFSTATHPWTFGVRSGISEASDYAGGDLYGGFEQQSFICKLYYALTANQPFEYMTSRCDPGLFDHTTTKSKDMLRLHAYLTYAHHGAFLAIDAIDPRGTLNTRFYKTLGKVFNETAPYEKYYTGKLQADYAVYFSLGSKMDSEEAAYPALVISKGDTGYPHLNSCLGAAKALRNAHIPYRVISDQKPMDLSGIEVLVLSDVSFMTDKEEDSIIDFVNNGGRVYISGITSPRLVKELLNLEIIGKTKENVTYVRPNEASLQYFCDMYDEQYPMTIFGTQRLAENHGGNTVLASVTLPYTDPADLTVLASIHSNPPGIDTDYPSIVLADYGKGKAIWSAAPFESSEQPVHKQVFVNLLNLLYNKPQKIITDASRKIEFTVFEDTERNLLQLHCVNIQTEFPASGTDSFCVSLHVSKPVQSILELPEQSVVPFTMQDNYVSFDVSDIDIFKMYELHF